MKIILFAATPIIGLIGLLILVKATRDSRRIYLGEVNSKNVSLMNAFLTGLSSSILFLTLIMIVGLLDKNYHLSIAGVLGSLIISIIFGSVAFLGAYFGFAIVRKYREFLGRKISEKIDKSRMK